MSIVERAIKKLQESQPQPATDRRNAVATEPVPAGTVPFDTEAGDPGPPAHAPEAAAPVRQVRFDVDRLRVHRLLPALEQERELAAQYRHIKRPLVSRALGRGQVRVARGNAIIICSALPGEGKTFTSVNLALSMALEQSVHVLLVDADVGKPRLTGEFGLEGEPGLLDALRNDAIDPASLVVGTDVPSLSLLPSGTLSSNSTELLASPRMDEVVELLCQGAANRIVVFDSPPLLPTTAARVLAQAMGQVVLVVRAGATPQQAVFEALHLLGDREHVNLVLTQAQVEAAGSYYYGSYGYGTYGEPTA